MTQPDISSETVVAYFKSLHSLKKEKDAEAVKAGLDTVKKALEDGVDPDLQADDKVMLAFEKSSSSEDTGLNIAAFHFFDNNPTGTNLTKLLLEHGADQSIPDCTDVIPICYNVGRRNADSFGLLVEDAKKTPNEKILLRWWAYRRNKEADNFIKENGFAELLPVPKDSYETPKETFKALTALWNNGEKPTELHEKMKNILKRIEVERRNDIFFKGLSSALETNYNSKTYPIKTEYADKIFKAGYSLKDMPDCWIPNIIHSERYDVRALRYLKEQGVDFSEINTREKFGLVQMAAYGGDLEKTKFFVDECGLPPDEQNSLGDAPLHCVAAGRLDPRGGVCFHNTGEHYRVADFLMERGASILAKNKDGKQPFEFLPQERDPTEKFLRLKQRLTPEQPKIEFGKCALFLTSLVAWCKRSFPGKPKIDGPCSGPK